MYIWSDYVDNVGLYHHRSFAELFSEAVASPVSLNQSRLPSASLLHLSVSLVCLVSPSCIPSVYTFLPFVSCIPFVSLPCLPSVNLSSFCLPLGRRKATTSRDNTFNRRRGRFPGELVVFFLLPIGRRTIIGRERKTTRQGKGRWDRRIKDETCPRP